MVRSHARRSGISSVDDLESESVSIGRASVGESAGVGNGNGDRPLISNSEEDVYVDPANGDDSNEGDSQNPVQTLQEAADRVPIYLRHDFTIILKDSTAYGGMVIHGLIQSDQATNGDPPILRIKSDSGQKSNVEVDYIHAIGTNGINTPKIQEITITGDVLNEHAGIAVQYGGATIDTVDVVGNSKSGSCGALAYNGTLKVEAAFDVQNKDFGVIAKRGGNITINELTGSVADSVLHPEANSLISYDSKDVTATGGSNGLYRYDVLGSIVDIAGEQTPQQVNRSFPVQETQEVSGSRSFNSWYDEPVGYPREIKIVAAASADATFVNMSLNINNDRTDNLADTAVETVDTDEQKTVSGKVPPNGSYKVESFGDTANYDILYWFEQRVGLR